MGKYVNLGEFLRSQKGSMVRLTFSDVERITGHRLPRSSRYPAWWSNNPSNNVMTQIWLEAGFKTEQVDIEGRKLVFRRVKASEPAIDDSRAAKNKAATTGGDHPAFGSMKGTVTVAPGVDLTEPADPDWGKVYDE
jgi:hypothetical protein